MLSNHLLVQYHGQAHNMQGYRYEKIFTASGHIDDI